MATGIHRQPQEGKFRLKGGLASRRHKRSVGQSLRQRKNKTPTYMALIPGVDFSFFWDLDRTKLKTLPFFGCVEWLQNRVDQVLVKPLDALAILEGNTMVWLAVTELVCAGIESLAGFYGKDSQANVSLCVYSYVSRTPSGDVPLPEVFECYQLVSRPGNTFT